MIGLGLHIGITDLIAKRRVKSLVSKRLKGLVAVSLIMCSALSMGCSKNEIAQKKKIEQLEATIEAKDEEISSLKKDMNNLTITEVLPETSLREVEGSTVPTFETIDGKIKFPNSLVVPNSNEDINNSYVQVGTKFKFTPSSNWLYSLKGATLNVNHPSKVWGSIKAISVADLVLEADMQPMLQKFFEGFPGTTITYRKVFIEDRISGMIAKSAIPVDGKEYMLNVGFVQRGEYGILLLFAYEDDKSGVQQELIDLLLSSGVYGDESIKLE